jgi:hypothetical protein
LSFFNKPYSLSPSLFLSLSCEEEHTNTLPHPHPNGSKTKTYRLPAQISNIKIKLKPHLRSPPLARACMGGEECGCRSVTTPTYYTGNGWISIHPESLYSGNTHCKGGKWVEVFGLAQQQHAQAATCTETAACKERNGRDWTLEV